MQVCLFFLLYLTVKFIVFVHSAAAVGFCSALDVAVFVVVVTADVSASHLCTAKDELFTK